VNEEETGRRVRSAFEGDYERPLPGFDSRMRAALQRSAVKTRHRHWALEAAALLMALVAVLVLMLPRILDLAPHLNGALPKPTPTLTPRSPSLVASPGALQNTKDGATWLFSRDHVYRSTDGGGHWGDASPRVVGFGGPDIAYALDAQQAWIAVPSQTGQGLDGVTFYRTTDGGANWVRFGSVPIAGSRLSQLTFVDSTHGWLLLSLGLGRVADEAVSVWRTTDGGSSWAEVARSAALQKIESPGQLPPACEKNGITFKNDLTGWVTAACAGGHAFLYRTTDGGHTWQAQPLPPAQSQTSQSLNNSLIVTPPKFLDQSFGLLPVDLTLGPNNVQSLVIYITRDGGTTWTPSTPVPKGRLMAAVATDYWIVIVPPRQVVVTHDGRQYIEIASDVDLSYMDEVSFVDAQHGLGMLPQADGGYQLVRTADGGAHWFTVTFSILQTG
jgi:photosystem II stability/assembly factor-like uncharacterized protein